MRIYDVTDRTPDLIAALLSVWESSVRATHLFLSETEILNIKKYVPEALSAIAHLIVAENDSGTPAAFMGVDDGSLEMLFISSDERGKGLGRKLMEKAIDEYSVNRLAVNEQNPQAVGFYRHMGFIETGRSDTDSDGRPYPILTMELKEGI